MSESLLALLFATAVLSMSFAIIGCYIRLCTEVIEEGEDEDV
jgi:hypothetical protein